MRTTSGQFPISLARKLAQKACDGVTGKPSAAYWIARLNKAFQGCRPPQDRRLNSKAWSHVSTVAAAVNADFGPRTGISALEADAAGIALDSRSGIAPLAPDAAVCAGLASPYSDGFAAACPTPDSDRTLPLRSLTIMKASPPNPLKCG